MACGQGMVGPATETRIFLWSLHNFPHLGFSLVKATRMSTISCLCGSEYMALHLVCSLEFSSAVMFVPEVVIGTRSRATPTCDTDPDDKGHQDFFDVFDC